jgi:hypothetical protein
MEKYQIDGAIAVVLSGTSWHGWSSEFVEYDEEMATDKAIVEAVMAADMPAVKARAEEILEEELENGIPGLVIEWVKIGSRFMVKVDEDGFEYIDLYHEDQWWTA